MDFSVILRTVGSLALISAALSAIISISEKVFNNYGT